MNSDA